MTPASIRIWVCMTGPDCCRRDPERLLDAFQQAVAQQGVGDRIEVVGGGCLGMCGDGPNVIVISGRSRTPYSHLTPADAAEIVAALAAGKPPVERLRHKWK